MKSLLARWLGGEGAPEAEAVTTITLVLWPDRAPRLAVRLTLRIQDRQSPLFAQTADMRRETVAARLREAVLARQLDLPTAPSSEERNRFLKDVCDRVGASCQCVVSNPAIGRIDLDGEQPPLGNRALRGDVAFRKGLRADLPTLVTQMYYLLPVHKVADGSHSLRKQLDDALQEANHTAAQMSDHCEPSDDPIDRFTDLPDLSAAIEALKTTFTRVKANELAAEDALAEAEPYIKTLRLRPLQDRRGA